MKDLSEVLSVEKIKGYFKGNLTQTATSSARTSRAAETSAASVTTSSTVAAVAATINRFSENRDQAGPNDRVQTRLANTRPETSVAPAAAPAAGPGLTAEIGQGFASMAQSIRIQTHLLDDMVDLMRKSVDLQGRILQQARN